MGRIIRRLVLLLLTLLLAGCGVEHELDLSKINKFEYVNEGVMSAPQPLLPSSRNKAFTDLVNWLEQNRSGWQPLEATLLPGSLTIYGDGFDLRVIHQTAILRYQDQSGEYLQLHKKIPADKFAFLTE